ncbi:MAG: HAD family hydrolase [Promethearchaeota archaeon]
MTKEKKILVSFDLDYTLIYNSQGIVNSFNYALNKYNLPPKKPNEIEKMIGDPLDHMFLEFSSIDPTILSSAFREFYSRKGIFQSQLIPGVQNILKMLKKHKFQLGVITSKKQEIAEKIVQYLNIGEYFEFVTGETPERKTLGKLDPSLKTIISNKFPEYQVIVVGDHPKDAKLSNNLECFFIGVLTGHYGKEELKKEKPNNSIVVSSVNEISIDLIKNLLKNNVT